MQANILCVATASDGKTMVVGTRTGEAHLYSTKLLTKPVLLKNSCRFIINSHAGLRRKEIRNLAISKHLIDYLVYQEIKVK